MLQALAKSPRFDSSSSRLRDLVNLIDAGSIRPDAADFRRLIADCTDLRLLHEARCIHSLVHRHGLAGDRLIGNYLVKMFVRCGDIDRAREVFDRVSARDVILWTEMIAAYGERGYFQESLELWKIMRLEGAMPDLIAFVTALKSCCCPASLGDGALIHWMILESGLGSNVIVETALVNMYARCGRIEQATAMFFGISHRDIVAWNAIIAVNAERGHFGQAMHLFHSLLLEGERSPNKSTYVAVLSACRDLHDLKLLHSCSIHSGLELHVEVATALVHAYAQLGHLSISRSIFDRLLCQDRDIVLWNAMIEAYAQEGDRESIALFRQMQLLGCHPDRATFLSLLSACSAMVDLEEGKRLHSRIGSCLEDFQIQNSLLAMYARCGRLELAQLLFDGMPERSVFSWNSMVAAYAQHGHLDQVFQSLKRMQNEGVKPDSVTFVSVLSACSGAGLLVEGRSHFEFVKRHIREWPSTEHYGCMIDLLGRLGRLEEAERLVLEVPDKAADAVLWRTLLAASRTYGDLERGRRAAERVVDLDPDDSAAYVVLYNTVAT
ncbi:pentatricopeptide repeat-containing protein At1g11290, chloroplastic [Selaginella moellendorffii]|uniref:pentatricopeptide repeat-containing protein At1g11290, chloroplastic n=1 Tax=Selaginella moellendorffii TaxID=88036 RepID=UPI000D1C9B85|nr:pentatricopeptide repeat-containing protein At1g11290, chloroplastic [Selaginella moellendorffii]|eukprot:XP_024537807.1 pentatricopeptide repeat-containing protein At1g11290, chloroplastic [Selaginella moellendorffii]